MRLALSVGNATKVELQAVGRDAKLIDIASLRIDRGGVATGSGSAPGYGAAGCEKRTDFKTSWTACWSHGVHRVVYVTSLGMAPAAPSEVAGRALAYEQFLQKSDLDATVIRPGDIVGVGGRGFDTIVSQAKRGD